MKGVHVGDDTIGRPKVLVPGDGHPIPHPKGSRRRAQRGDGEGQVWDAHSSPVSTSFDQQWARVLVTLHSAAQKWRSTVRQRRAWAQGGGGLGGRARPGRPYQAYPAADILQHPKTCAAVRGPVRTGRGRSHGSRGRRGCGDPPLDSTSPQRTPHPFVQMPHTAAVQRKKQKERPPVGVACAQAECLHGHMQSAAVGAGGGGGRRGTYRAGG